MLSLLSDEMRRNPYPVFSELRAASPVLRDPQSGLWMLLDYESVKRALFDYDSFRSSVTPVTGKAPDWLVFSDPPRHTKMRAIIAKAFTPRSISSLEPRIRQLSSSLLDPLLEQDEIDLARDYAGPLPVLVIAEMLGIPQGDRARFLHWSEVIVGLSYSLVGGEAAAKAIQAYFVVKEEIKGYLAELLAERRETPREDLLSRLVEAEVDGEQLSEEDIVGFFQLLLTAATETTTNLIDNAVLCLLENPDQLTLLRGAPELLPKAIEEVLRYRSPGSVFFREAASDIELHGQKIAKGTLVLAMIGAANRDPKQFKDPERFDIKRDPNPHIAFGHGIHFCIGAALSRLEAKVALSDLLHRCQDLSLRDVAPWEPRPALHVHGPTKLPLRLRSAAK
jgi:cytochrome P450